MVLNQVSMLSTLTPKALLLLLATTEYNRFWHSPTNAGDDRVQPILAFSDEGAFVSENMPDHIRFFLDGYTDEIQYTIDNQQEISTDIQQQWDALISESHVLPKDGNVVVGPLLGNNQWTHTAVMQL